MSDSAFDVNDTFQYRNLFLLLTFHLSNTSCVAQRSNESYNLSMKKTITFNYSVQHVQRWVLPLLLLFLLLATALLSYSVPLGGLAFVLLFIAIVYIVYIEISSKRRPGSITIDGQRIQLKLDKNLFEFNKDDVQGIVQEDFIFYRNAFLLQMRTLSHNQFTLNLQNQAIVIQASETEPKKKKRTLNSAMEEFSKLSRQPIQDKTGGIKV